MKVMQVIAEAFVALIALEHVGFMFLEMVVWRTPRGQKFFGTTPEFAAASAALAANQGLYNGFLAAGLGWGLVLRGSSQAFSVDVFFLVCVIVAGVFGGLTAKRSILLWQAAPAAVAFALLLVSH